MVAEVYFDDLKMVWEYWGDRENMEEGEVKEILKRGGKVDEKERRKRDRERERDTGSDNVGKHINNQY